MFQVRAFLVSAVVLIMITMASLYVNNPNDAEKKVVKVPAAAANADIDFTPDRVWVTWPPQKKPKMIVRFWFTSKDQEYRQVARTIVSFAKERNRTVAVFGFIGSVDADIEKTAKGMKLWRPTSAVLINEREDANVFENGAPRKIALTGKPGTNYSLADLKRAMARAYETETAPEVSFLFGYPREN